MMAMILAKTYAAPKSARASEAEVRAAVGEIAV
jgi:hypothetical protein